MMMKKFFCMVFLMASLLAQGQVDTNKMAIYDSTTTLVLSTGKSFISKAQLKKGFSVRLNDQSARLIKFSLVYYYQKDDEEGHVMLVFRTPQVLLDRNYPPKYLRDKGSNFVTLEHIIFERDGKLYSGKGVFLPVK